MKPIALWIVAILSLAFYAGMWFAIGQPWLRHNLYWVVPAMVLALVVAFAALFWDDL